MRDCIRRWVSFMKRRSLKKYNKGFSLVELIVVVLIMAIIAVALAPRVMRWVNESRVSADAYTYDTVVAAAQDALSDEGAWKKCESISFTITINGNTSGDTFIMDNTAPEEFVDEFYKHCGGSDAVSNIKLKQKDCEAIITVNKGDVVRTKAPSEKAGH